MDFTLTVNLDNAAFGENPDELADILERLGAGITPLERLGVDAGHVRDSNGNTVGRWEVSDETAPAAVHLAEIRDLAARLRALIDHGDHPDTIENLALDLVELVNHYEPNQ